MTGLFVNRRGPLVGAGVAGAAALAAGAPLLPPERCLASAVLAAIMAAIALHDLSSFRVPNALSLAAALSGLVVVALIPTGGREALSALACALLGGIVCGGMLLAVRELFRRLRGYHGLGLGDVKLAAAAGIWLRPELFLRSLLLASIAGLAFAVYCYSVDRRWNRARRIPFAAGLAPAIWLCWHIDQLLIFRAFPNW